MDCPKNKKIYAFGSLFTAITVWGLSAIVSKEAYTEVNPFLLLFLRFAISSIILLPFLFIGKNKRRIPRYEFKRIVLFGILLTVLGAGGWVIGLYFTTATRAALITSTGPLFTLILERIILKRKESKAAYFGVTLGLIGSLIVIISPILLNQNVDLPDVPDKSLMWLGDLLILISAMGPAVFSVLESREKEQSNPYQKIVLYFIVATVFSLVPALFVHFNTPDWALSAGPKAWFGIFYYAIGCSAIAYILYQWGTERVTPLQSSLFFYLQPLITIIAAMVILGEDPNCLELVGGILILFGLTRSVLKKPQHIDKN